jgi:hypothetical protein
MRAGRCAIASFVAGPGLDVGPEDNEWRQGFVRQRGEDAMLAPASFEHRSDRRNSGDGEDQTGQ